MKVKKEILPDAIYTTEEAAELLGLNILTIQTYIRNGLIEGTMIGGKWYRVSGKALLDFMETYKKVRVVPNSQKMADGKWKPRVGIYIDNKFEVNFIPYEWPNQRHDSKETADYYAKFATKKIIENGGLKKMLEVIGENKQNKEDKKTK